MSDTPTTPCKACGKPVIFASDMIRGTCQILDASAPVYSYEIRNGHTVCARLENAAVSHFATCPNANDFSRKSKDNP
jgi:hypothetical protein